MEKKLFLLDAYALVFRAYYALIRSPRITSKNKNTNAQFGFTNTLVELLNKQKPTHMAVCFDTHEPTERHIDYAEYKANRQETPEDILIAVPDIKRIIKGFNIPCVETDGYEADDVIGTLAKKAAAEGYDVYMVTPDKDYGQLVSEKIKIYKPGYQGGDVEIMGPEEVCAKWNIKNVSQVIDVLGLMGDAVDNIPGIAGVGEKTAAKLLAEYETLENVVANAENIKGALGKKVVEGKDLAILSKKLATIIVDVPVEFHEEEFKVKEWNKDALKEIFGELEFRTLAKRLLGEEVEASTGATAPGDKKAGGKSLQIDLFGNVIGGEEEAPATPATVIPDDDVPSFTTLKKLSDVPHEYTAISGLDAVNQLVQQLSSFDEICFDTETTSIDANLAELVGMSFSVKAGEAYWVPCPADRTETDSILAAFRPLFEDESKTWIGQNLKYDLLVMKWYNVEFKESYSIPCWHIT
uniref:5'-3' exonuclease H3TH domain-containing protein n=1 Tax=Niabella hibiscisoli TaxID=1825928 RepID=UPI0021D42359|nr:5'-3' exonuclease H3TH domain-containing protein [Niabella hibiscisoli]